MMTAIVALESIGETSFKVYSSTGEAPDTRSCCYSISRVRPLMLKVSLAGEQDHPIFATRKVPGQFLDRS